MNKSVKKHKDAKLLRRRLISNQKQKKRNKSLQGLSKSEVDFIKQFKDYNKINAPINFSFVHSTEKTVEFIRKIERSFSIKQKIFVNLERVEYIDNSAIIVLLSVMNLFRSRGLGFGGNYPIAEDAAILLYNSGFLKSLFRGSRKLTYTFGKKNQLFTQENKKVVASLGHPLMIEVGFTIFGERKIFKGLQRILLELMQNTNNHAVVDNKGQKNWWLSVNHDRENNKVAFSFVDYGVGVFESLKSKKEGNKWFGAFEKVKNRLKYGTNEEVLKLLLNGDLHMTVTGKHFRGKGIPGMKQVLDRNQISNLHVITNDAYADVSGNNYKKLRNHFSGTFVYWDIDDTNQTTEWSIK